MSPEVRQRHQRARLAMWLAQPKVLFATWIIPFGVLALVSFIAIPVSLFVPSVSLAWISTVSRTMSGGLLLLLLVRGVLLRRGWMPVSRHDLMHALALPTQPYAVQEALLHAWAQQRWVTWNQVWALRGRPEGLVEALFEGHSWRRQQGSWDRPAAARDARAVLPLEVNRHADAMALAVPTATRVRRRS